MLQLCVIFHISEVTKRPRLKLAEGSLNFVFISKRILFVVGLLHGNKCVQNTVFEILTDPVFLSSSCCVCGFKRLLLL